MNPEAPEHSSIHGALSELNERCGWDCTLSAFDGWRLKLSSGSPETSQRPLAELGGVSYIACPTEFSHPTFRVASAVEREKIRMLVHVDEDDVVLAIDAETLAGLEPHVFFVVAKSVEVVAR